MFFVLLRSGLEQTETDERFHGASDSELGDISVGVSIPHLRHVGHDTDGVLCHGAVLIGRPPTW